MMCCHIGCDKVAEWAGYPNPHPYNESYACEEHAGDLLDTGYVHTIWFIGEVGDGKEST